MKRREFLGALGSAAILWPFRVRAQQTGMPVVGFLGVSSAEAFRDRLSAFHQGLAEGGFIEGQNVRFEYRWAGDVAGRLPELAADLVRRNVTVIATGGGPAPALAAKAATSIIPVVFATPGSDPLELGLVTSMNRPSNNVTGVGFLVSTISAKQLEVIHEAVPDADLIGLLVNPSNPNASYYVRNVQSAANALGRKVLVLRATTDTELEAAFATLLDRRARALIAIPDVFFFRRKDRLVAWAAEHSVPAIYGSRDFPESGGLMSYGTNINDGYRQQGVYVSRVLKGARPADLPVQQATKIEFAINLRAARALGLTLPITLLGRADEVIE